jgi:pimeloyl-ACP methyl ester carboxylesterase
MAKWIRQKLSLDNGYYYSILFYNGSTNKTILFIHGLGSAKEDFTNALECPRLLDYNLLAVDLLGHGDSIKPDNFSYKMKDQAEYLISLLQELALEDDFVIVAHSMGGPVAISLAEQLEQKPKAIIYAEGNIDFNDCFGSNAIISSGSLSEWKKELFQQAVTDLKADNNSVSSSYALSFEKAGPITTYLSSLDLVNISRENVLLQRLIDLNIPILAIYGEKNEGKFTSEEKLKRYFPIKYISNAEHDMMISNPDDFYNNIIDFLANIQ